MGMSDSPYRFRRRFGIAYRLRLFPVLKRWAFFSLAQRDSGPASMPPQTRSSAVRQWSGILLLALAGSVVAQSPHYKVNHAPRQPRSDEPVKVTVSAEGKLSERLSLELQVVEPG